MCEAHGKKIKSIAHFTHERLTFRKRNYSIAQPNKSVQDNGKVTVNFTGTYLLLPPLFMKFPFSSPNRTNIRPYSLMFRSIWFGNNP
jgi:hypothetical protein